MSSLPGGNTFTAERAAYSTLLEKAKLGFVFGREPGFDLAECSDNPYNEWIGAQIRADLYGWVCPRGPRPWQRTLPAAMERYRIAVTVLKALPSSRP